MNDIDNYEKNGVDNLIIAEYKGDQKEIIIPEGVLWIDHYAFKDNKNIETVYMPESVGFIGEEAFAGCTSLKYVHLSSQIQRINDRAFKGCTSLEEIVIPGTPFIGDESFKDCTSLKYIKVFEGCEEVGFSAFENCTSLECADLCDSIKEICGGAFWNCQKLNQILLPSGEDIDLIFEECFKGCGILKARLDNNENIEDEPVPDNPYDPLEDDQPV